MLSAVYVNQTNDLEREIKQKTGGAKQGPAKNLGGMVNAGPTLEPRLMITIVCFFKKVFEWGEQFVSHNQVVWHIQRSVDRCWRHRVLWRILFLWLLFGSKRLNEHHTNASPIHQVQQTTHPKGSSELLLENI